MPIRLFTIFLVLISFTGCASSVPDSAVSIQDKQVQEETSGDVFFDIAQGVSYYTDTIMHGDFPLTVHIVKVDAEYSSQLVLKEDVDTPKYVHNWGKSVFTINGGYYLEDYSSAGLFIENGIVSQQRMFDQDASGLFQITSSSADIRDLAKQPWSSEESLTYAVQSFPFLLRNGESVITKDSGKVARRTIVANDSQDNMYFIIISDRSISLFDAAQLLEGRTEQFITALNLDGGPSTGLYIENVISIPSYSAIPNVILFQQ